jgi:hypothetical protein
MPHYCLEISGLDGQSQRFTAVELGGVPVDAHFALTSIDIPTNGRSAMVFGGCDLGARLQTANGVTVTFHSRILDGTNHVKTGRVGGFLIYQLAEAPYLVPEDVFSFGGTFHPMRMDSATTFPQGRHETAGPISNLSAFFSAISIGSCAGGETKFQSMSVNAALAVTPDWRGIEIGSGNCTVGDDAFHFHPGEIGLTAAFNINCGVDSFGGLAQRTAKDGDPTDPNALGIQHIAIGRADTGINIDQLVFSLDSAGAVRCRAVDGAGNVHPGSITYIREA